jgi:hypothetical protein
MMWARTQALSRSTTAGLCPWPCCKHTPPAGVTFADCLSVALQLLGSLILPYVFTSPTRIAAAAAVAAHPAARVLLPPASPCLRNPHVNECPGYNKSTARFSTLAGYLPLATIQAMEWLPMLQQHTTAHAAAVYHRLPSTVYPSHGMAAHAAATQQSCTALCCETVTAWASFTFTPHPSSLQPLQMLLPVATASFVSSVTIKDALCESAAACPQTGQQ